MALPLVPWRISPRFVPFAALFALSGGALYCGAQASLLVVVFIFCGWIISLCLHEAAHALAAFYGGDKSVVKKGYLSLDPFAYAHPGLSFGLPLLYLFLGGLGLPGGAVQIDQRVLKSRWHDSLVSAAGPAANGLCLLLLAAPFALGLPEQVGAEAFWGAVAFLAWLQATSLFFNLLPIPGFDGFGILEPHLPYDMQAQGKVLARNMCFLMVFFVALPQVGSAVSHAGYVISEAAGLDTDYVFLGYAKFRLRT